MTACFVFDVLVSQSLLRLLECPVCLEWMEPPIAQCRRGHLVCARCRTRLAYCPVCRTAFSSVRNRAMEGVAEMLRYPCRHGCGREVRLRRRAPHEASCEARRYRCPAPACHDKPPYPHAELSMHFQNKHISMLKFGRKHQFSMKVNTEQHDNWIIMTLHELFHLRVDVDIRSWGVVVYVAYIGPKCNAADYTYEVTVHGHHHARKLVYTRSTHCDLECSTLNVSRQDCFHLTLDQALNFLRVMNRHCEPDKFLNFTVEISKCEEVEKRDSDS
ncbi:E3 ubiquitin-protein ligase SIAH1-like [Hyposmocoma kahamanoa]|uniref:E3 ubiquitin-protein ligase SIAH1-like n=1 Tax=Hyposmocoma kahamanoa TaxID=1477025 RepID=UPI000E6D8B4E|nr:E3 ubiquitin-protein ligase SIAH1-like [Hyposmocoma kahamanoa]